jgi:pilus assembly protein Flp/PilA
MFERTKKRSGELEAVNSVVLGAKNMKSLINRFVKDESGATAIEYGLIAGLLSVVIIAAVSLAGTSLTSVFTSISTKLNDSIKTAP